jgi:hypothetical protein
MDTLRGTFESNDTPDPYDLEEESRGAEPDPRDHPPASIGQDERRMQVRAYNHWAGLLGEGSFPSIEDLDFDDLPDFGPHCVLLDFSKGVDDPHVPFIGGKLREECGTSGQINRLSDVPARSLLSRITDHYLQIMANQAPIGFEAEFINQRGVPILYRGILLPFSSDDETIDFICGVINWKEMASQSVADELLLEIDQAIDGPGEGDREEPEVGPRVADPVTDWADSPAYENGAADDDEADTGADEGGDADSRHSGQDNVTAFARPHGLRAPDEWDEHPMPLPDFGKYSLDDPEYDEDEGEDEDSGAGYSFASLADHIATPVKKAVDLDAEQFDPEEYQLDAAGLPFDSDAAEPAEAAFEPAPEPALQPAPIAETSASADAPAVPLDVFGRRAFVADEEQAAPALAPLAEDADLHDCLASARELARSARTSEDRSRQALYEAVGRAYDFSVAASEAPGEYAALVEQSGLTVQDRAPMTPIVKLVFGSEYDKTRLTEYAAVLSHAHRLELPRGTLGHFLSEAEGGLKAVVKAERRLRREEGGKPVESEHAVRAVLARKLRELEALTLEALAQDGPEFALVMVRRTADGRVAVLGELEQDIAQIERAARRLIG